MSLHIIFWYLSDMHKSPFDESSGARDLTFGMNLHLYKYILQSALKTLVSMHICVGSPELFWLRNATCTKFSNM